MSSPAQAIAASEPTPGVSFAWSSETPCERIVFDRIGVEFAMTEDRIHRAIWIIFNSLQFLETATTEGDHAAHRHRRNHFELYRGGPGRTAPVHSRAGRPVHRLGLPDGPFFPTLSLHHVRSPRRRRQRQAGR